MQNGFEILQHIKTSSGGFHHPPPPPFLYLGRGVTLRVRPRVQSMHSLGYVKNEIYH